MSILRSIIPAAVVALMFASVSLAANNETLEVGSKAPEIDIEHWVSDGHGKFEPVEKFEEDKVYVIEFWATWCGPCIASMPHLAELQEKHAKNGLQIISISDEKLKVVEKFLKKDVRGQDDKTYGELTSAYCLTADPDKSVYEDYMDASGATGIPTAFIVGKTGVIEWIGHPMSMDEPLELILSGDWDREAFLKKEREKARIEKKTTRVLRKVYAKLNEEEFEEAIEMLDKAIKKEDEDAVKVVFQGLRINVFLNSDLESENLAVEFGDYVDEIKDNPQQLNQVAWGIVEMKMAGEKDVSDDLLAAALKAGELAVKNSPEDYAILDTLGHLLYLNGKLDRAIEVQTKAVKNAGGDKADIEPLLKKMLKEKKEKESDDK